MSNKSKIDDAQCDSDLSMAHTDESLCKFTRTGSFTDREPKGVDFDTWSQSSLDMCE